MVSMVSAVPAGEVMAREEVFGMVKPRAATMATTMGVVRLPGSPPTECLSTTISEFQDSLSPASTIALVSARISRSFNGRAAQAVMNEERWMSGYLPSTTSPIVVLRAVSPSSCP
jgi:hypothetical protein